MKALSHFSSCESEIKTTESITSEVLKFCCSYRQLKMISEFFVAFPFSRVSFAKDLRRRELILWADTIVLNRYRYLLRYLVAFKLFRIL